MTLALGLTVLAVWLGGDWLSRALACGGDPPPPRCGKSLVFSIGNPGPVKASDEPTTVVLPGYIFLTVVEIPPGTGICPPPPYAAVVDLRLECPGNAPVLSSVDIPDLPVGHNEIRLPITVPPGPPRKCILTAKVTVSFSDGMRISRTTRTCICVVDCSEKDPSLPRLDLAPFFPDTEIARTHPGDQTSFRYVVTNNDPDHTFRGVLNVRSTNEAKRPVDESPGPAAFGMGVFGISDELGDAFPIAFREDLGEDCIRLPPEPQRLLESTLDRVIVLGPCESREVEVVLRSWGMCANGSCGQVTLTFDGRFTDRTRGLACATAIAVADTGQRPRYAWPDSGKVGNIFAEGPSLVVVGEPSPTRQDIVQTEMVALSLQGQPVPIQVQAVPLTHPATSQQPEKGRVEMRAFPDRTFQVDSFFDIDYRIDFAGEPGGGQPIVEGLQVVEGAPAGFENAAPLSMGVLRVPNPELRVDSFFDITYQLSGYLEIPDVPGESSRAPLSFFDVFFEVEVGGVVVHARARAELGPDVGAGGVAGAPGGPVVVLNHDLSAFARPGIGAPCEAPEIVDLRCLPRDDQICMFWGIGPAGCLCERIQIMDAAGNVLLTLDGNATSACIPCDRLPELQGTLSVNCLDRNGEIVARAFCEYDCGRCPPIEILRCTTVQDFVVLGWTPPAESCCDRIVLRHRPSGTVIATLPATAGAFRIPCSQLPTVIGEICVECVDAAGRVLSEACCRYECDDPCPQQIEANCDPTADGLVIAWSAIDPRCCAEYVVYLPDDPENILDTLPAGTTFVEYTCARLAAIGAPLAGAICIDCVGPDGSRRRVICCDYNCPDPCPPQIEANCDPTANGLVIAWAPIDPDCCERFVVYEGSDPATILLTLPAGTTSVDLSCDRLEALGAPLAGEICVDCVTPDGRRRQIICCDYECRVECPPFEVRCESSPNGLRMSWPSLPPECCERFEIFDSSDPTAILMTLPAGSTEVSFTCEEIVRLTGRSRGSLCVQCVAPDGMTVRRCCEYDCPRDCPPLEIDCAVVDAAGAGPVVRVTWTPPGDECCDGLRIFVRANGVERQIGAVAPDVGAFSIPCSEIPASGEICVRCFRDGQVVDEACCDYACPDCPPFELLRCELTPNGLIMTWSPVPERCCERFVVRDGNNTEIATLPASATSFSIPCERLIEITGARAGVVCVYCVAPDGTESRICCDYSCPGDDAGGQVPGDCNQDGNVDISDALCLLGHLFLGRPPRLPCGDGSVNDPGNVALLDWNGDGRIDLADPISGLGFLFTGGRPHVLGRECTPILRCPEVCRVP